MKRLWRVPGGWMHAFLFRIDCHKQLAPFASSPFRREFRKRIGGSHGFPWYFFQRGLKVVWPFELCASGQLLSLRNILFKTNIEAGLAAYSDNQLQCSQSERTRNAIDQ
jgi:hypothetical protein